MAEAAERAKLDAASGGSRWAFQIATLFGIPIRIHASFILILLWAGMSLLAFVLALFACVVLHELGHAVMARRFGVRTREIVLYPIGGVARLESIPGGWAELAIALAGPAVNVVIAAICAVALVAFQGTAVFRPTMELPQEGLIQQLLSVNVGLVVFNMMPAFPMDGGRVLRAILAIGLGQQRATRIAGFIGQAIAVAFVFGGLFQGNYVLAFVGVFVFLGASQEVAFQTRRQAVVGRTAQEAMITKFESLAPADSLGRAAELMLATHQHDFPVLDAWGRIAGVLPRARLLEGLAKTGREATVLEFMLREPVQLPPTTDLEKVLQHLQSDPATPLLIADGGKLLGMITFENLAEFIVVARQIGR